MLFLCRKGGEAVANGKYHEWLEPDGLTRIEAWARDGLTEEQIAKNMGIVSIYVARLEKQVFGDFGGLKKGQGSC